MTVTSSSERTCETHEQESADAFNVSAMMQQLDEIFATPMPPRLKLKDQRILNQINARLSQIETIDRVVGGAYEDVCKIHNGVGFVIARATKYEKQARQALVRHKLAVPNYDDAAEYEEWEFKFEELVRDMGLYELLRVWGERVEKWAADVHTTMESLGEKVHPMKEKLARQKSQIERLYQRTRTTTCKVEMLGYELEACSIELDDDDGEAQERLMRYSSLMKDGVPFVPCIDDPPVWSDAEEYHDLAKEAERLYDVARDIEGRS